MIPRRKRKSWFSPRTHLIQGGLGSHSTTGRHKEQERSISEGPRYSLRPVRVTAPRVLRTVWCVGCYVECSPLIITTTCSLPFYNCNLRGHFRRFHGILWVWEEVEKCHSGNLTGFPMPGHLGVQVKGHGKLYVGPFHWQGEYDEKLKWFAQSQQAVRGSWWELWGSRYLTPTCPLTHMWTAIRDPIWSGTILELLLKFWLSH